LETCKSGSEGGKWKRTETYLASYLPYLKKGSKVFIEGRLTADQSSGGPRIWTKSDGTPQANFELTIVTIKFLDGKSESSGGDPGGSAPEDDNIPF